MAGGRRLNLHIMWKDLNDAAQLAAIIEESKTSPVVLFKHSTRCSISSMAKSRLERAGMPEGITFYLLDLIRYRSVSNQIAEDFGVLHQSPQVVLLIGGKCVYHASHSAISMDEIETQATVAK